MRRMLLAAGMLLMLMPAASPAVTLMVNGDTPSVRYQRWADESAIPLPAGIMQLTLAGSIDDGNSLCEGDGDACYWNLPEPKIVLLAVPAVSSRRVTRENQRAARGALYHELGHWVDRRLLPNLVHDDFRRLVGEKRPWESSPDSPHERFAETFKLCALGPKRAARSWSKGYWTTHSWSPGYYEGGYALSLSRNQLATACGLIASATS